MQNWKISEHQRVMLLRDGASNITKGDQLANLESCHCTIHLLQLCVTKSIFVQSGVKQLITETYVTTSATQLRQLRNLKAFKPIHLEGKDWFLLGMSLLDGTQLI